MTQNALRGNRMPVRGQYTSKDGYKYPLWIDIEDIIKTLLPIYWSERREERQERDMAFRGQSNAEWNLVPTLFRQPFNEKIIRGRQQYTQNFIRALIKKGDDLGLKNPSEMKLLAIAQHYGFYTHLLDFSRSIEVAAYFATRTEHSPRIGAIFGYPISEYNQLRNPFSSLGISLSESEELLGDDALAPFLDENFDDVPRIYHQEGIFIECPVNRIKAVQRNCIDRYYFYQRQNHTYQGKFAFNTGLPSPSMFSTKDAYMDFMEIARREHPELFKKTAAFDSTDLFPPVDPLSAFVVEWRKTNPDPTIIANQHRKIFSFFDRLFGKAAEKVADGPLVSMIETTAFAAAVDDYYFDRERRTPYEVSVIQRGRELVESLCEYKEMDSLNSQRWLLWELLKNVTENKYTCIVKLNSRTSTGQEDTKFHFFIYDRWLVESYNFDIPIEQAQQGFWHIHFNETCVRRWVEKQELKAASRLFSEQEQYHPIKGNPFPASTKIKQIFSTLNKTLKNCSEGECGSFVYDLQRILMKEFGRDLQIILGMGNRSNCCFFSPMVDMDCIEGKPYLIIEIYDGFFHTLKRTSICPKHWRYYTEGDINFFNPTIEFSLGLA